MAEGFPKSGDGRFAVARTEARMAEELAAIQEACFPTLNPADLIRAEHYRAHVTVFPEGQHVVVEAATGRPVASSTDFRTTVDFSHYQHRYIDAVGGNWLSRHEPEGDWLYGADIGVHPDFRGLGLARLLYDARQALVRRLGLAGHVAGGMPKGYGARSQTQAIEAYLTAVVRGEVEDPVLSLQLRRGYHAYGIMPGYVDDPSSAGYGVLIVWRNPDLRPRSGAPPSSASPGVNPGFGGQGAPPLRKTHLRPRSGAPPSSASPGVNPGFGGQGAPPLRKTRRRKIKP